MVPRRLDGSVGPGSRPGSSEMVRAQRGGVYQKQRGGCTTPPVHCSPSLFVFFVLERLSRSAPAETDKTGATPHFLPLARIG